MFQSYKRARYAGNVFRTQASQVNLKGDDSHVRFDYRAAEGGQALRKGFATILRLFEHRAYPGGPSRVVVEGNWWTVVGTCPIAGTTLGKEDADHAFNHSSRFVFLDECYQRPIAIWPHDPFQELDDGDERKQWFDVIDRNQASQY